MIGTVGLPLPGVDMRLEAVPELGYLPSDAKAPRGEVGSIYGGVHDLGCSAGNLPFQSHKTHMDTCVMNNYNEGAQDYALGSQRLSARRARHRRQACGECTTPSYLFPRPLRVVLLLVTCPVQVCLRGPVLYSGYYKQPELTAQSTDKDGFFHTGVHLLRPGW